MGTTEHILKGTPVPTVFSGLLIGQDPGTFKQPHSEMRRNTHLHLCILGLWEQSPRGNYQLLPP